MTLAVLHLLAIVPPIAVPAGGMNTPAPWPPPPVPPIPPWNYWYNVVMALIQNFSLSIPIVG